MILMFDTNIWVSELGLNTTKGAAIKFYIKQNKAKIALPEVIRLETEENLREVIHGNIQQINKNYRQLLSIFGKIKELVLPTDEEIDNQIKGLFPFKSLEFVENGFTFDNAKSAFNRVIKKLPPSQKNQQFKDCVIWNHCLELLKNEDVILVTKDKAFYEGDDYKNGINNFLKSEINVLPNKFRIFSDLKDVMVDLKKEIEIDDKYIHEEILRNHQLEINSFLNESGLILSGKYDIQKSLYITEDINKLLLELIIKAECEKLTDPDNTDIFMRLVCSCAYQIAEKKIEDVRFDELSVIEVVNEIENNLKSILYLSSNIVLGHRTIQNKIKHQVE